ncbi:MAG: pilus assembly protein PilM [Phycisphaeraceae bacterium]
MNKSRLTPIAIDFGVDTLKMLQISTGETTQLIGAGALVMPEAARKDGGARYTFLADAVKELVRQQPFKGRRVMCAIPAFQTFVNTFELQCNENDDINQQVNLHLQTVMEKDPTRMVIRNQRIGSVIRDGATRQRVICIAASRAVVMRYLEIAAAAKLEVVGMHSEPVCIARCFSELYNRREADQTEARCFIDIGSASTSLVIVRGQEILLARNIAVSGDDLTRQHASEHDTDFAAARLARMREASNPLAANPFGVGSGDRASSAAAASSAAVATAEPDDTERGDPRESDRIGRPQQIDTRDEVIDTLVDGIRMAVRYHDSVCPETPVKRAILLGGEAHHHATAAAVAHAFGVPTYVGDPMARVMRTPGLDPVNIDVNQPQPGWAVPLGLCLSEANL